MLTADLAAKYAAPFGDRDADNLYAAILDEPWADHLRGILADRLEEIGDGDRAAFVRCQLELADLGIGCTYYEGHNHDWEKAPNGKETGRCLRCMRRDALRASESALLATHGREWAAPLAGVLPKCGRCDGKGSLPKSTMPSAFGTCPDCHGVGLPVEFVGGFVGRVQVTLRQFVGSPCALVNEDGHSARCTFCRGTGRTPGLADALALRMPLLGVELTDRRPTPYDHMVYPESSDDWVWWYSRIDAENDDPRRPNTLPKSLWDHLPCDDVVNHWKHYPTADAACAALSAACRDLARSWCGLPAWAATGG